MEWTNRNMEATTTEEEMTSLPRDFLPGKLDVICGRGREARDHEGNIAFRGSIESEIEHYSKMQSKLEKSTVVSQIVDSIRKASPKGGFVRKGIERWYSVPDHIAREKVGQR
jgi:hypothetical protein